MPGSPLTSSRWISASMPRKRVGCERISTDRVSTTKANHVMASLAQMAWDLLAERSPARRAGRGPSARPSRRPGTTDDTGESGIGPEALEQRDVPTGRDVAQDIGVSVTTLDRWAPAATR